ncbi:HD domain-containing protein [Bradyrhizobium sp. HKCCYLS3077]|uniref:HD domain-containing protein n=1 Tax=Bradyrhizobium sp. HKCCYLS3077 TaxID=3420761 RepID=UPI003EBFA384
MPRKAKTSAAKLDDANLSYYGWEESLYRDTSEAARLLIHTLDTLRSRLRPVLDKISQFLPGLTNHSLKHIDNLRRVTEEIIPRNALSPLEVYCLNVAYLIHDACLSPILYDGGPEAIRASDVYQRLLALQLRSEGVAVSDQSVDNYLQQNSNYSEDKIFFSTLRQVHASEAARILKEFNKDGVYLIDHPELRIHSSEICGPIAASHHLPHVEVEERLLKRRAFPRISEMNDTRSDALSVRDFYLSLILRVVDACQLEGRAPYWDRLLQSPTGYSALHWDFQGALSVGYDHKNIVFNVFSAPCPLAKASSWWAAYDYLHDVVAPELDAANRYVAENAGYNYKPFRRSCVAGIESPRAFRTINPTDGWEPVDVKPAIRDPLKVIELLGGEKLYGSDPFAAVRELVQNALDASDALEKRRELTGARYDSIPVEIEVRTDADTSRIRVSVRDHGVGMTKHVLTEVLTDFARSIWSSEDNKTDAAWLLRKGLRPRGRFGIGFFSVFMIGQSVRIITRPDGKDESYALDFKEGLSHRPLLTPLKPEERVRLGASGTEVSFELKLGLDNFKARSLAKDAKSIYQYFSSLETLVRYVFEICPLVNRALIVSYNGQAVTLPSIRIEDLKDNWPLFNERVLGSIDDGNESYAHCKLLFEGLVEMQDDEGKPLGLIAPNLLSGPTPTPVGGVVIDGGLRVQTVPTFFGIAHGAVIKADRATARSALRRSSAESIKRLVQASKTTLAIEAGRCNLRKVKGKAALFKDVLVAEFLPFDPEFSAALAAKKGRAKSNDKLSDWCNVLRRKGRLVFYIPEFSEGERGQIFGHAYSVPSLPAFSRASMLAYEVLGLGSETIAQWLAKHFSREIGHKVNQRFARVAVGQREGREPIYCFGISFLREGLDENFSPVEADIAEMYQLKADDVTLDVEG